MEIYSESCSLPSCNQTDFLPFRCDACNKIFCLDHRTYAAHSCADAHTRDVTVVVCPKCKKGLRVSSTASPRTLNNTVNDHMSNSAECVPKTVQKCQAPGCKTKLNLSNRYKCEKCGCEVCLKHRFEEDHDCKPLKSVVPAAAAAGGGGKAQASSYPGIDQDAVQIEGGAAGGSGENRKKSSFLACILGCGRKKQEDGGGA